MGHPASVETNLVIRFFEGILGRDSNSADQIRKSRKIAKHPFTSSIETLYFFTMREFMIWIGLSSSGTKFRNNIIRSIFETASKNGLIYFDLFHDDVILLNHQLARFLHKYDILDNLLNDIEANCNKYKNSIVEVVVEQNGEPFSGTAFKVTDFDFITNKHVVFDETGEERNILCAKNSTISLNVDKISPHDSIDISVITVKETTDAPILHFDYAHRLDEVVAIGYPRVSRSNFHPQLFSKGQVNGFYESYDAETPRLGITDAKIAPGNSGGPVINDKGFVCGVVVEDLVASSEHGAYSHSAFLPSQLFASDIIGNKLEEYLGPSLQTAAVKQGISSDH